MLKKHERENHTKLFDQCLDKLKIATKRYAKKQDRWVLNRLVNSQGRAVPPVYDLDSTDVEQWSTNVNEKAIKIVSSFLNNEVINVCETPRQEKKKIERKIYTCNICQKYLCTREQYDLHMNARGHKRQVAAVRNREKQLAMKQDKQLAINIEFKKDAVNT